MFTSTQPRFGTHATVEASFGTTPRVPLTGFSVFGLLTFWVYTAVRLAFLLREHMRKRWEEFGTQLERAGATPDQLERWRHEGFHTRIAVPIAAACMYGVSWVLVLAWCVRWSFLGTEAFEGFLDIGTVLKVVGTSAIFFYVATCLLVIWTMRRIHAHEMSELAIREHGVDIAGNDRIVPDEAMVARWEEINNHVSLFLILSLAMVSAPVLTAYLFLTGATADYAGLPALVCFVIGGVFHFWGTRLLLGLFNSHLALETAHRGGWRAADARGTDAGTASQPRATAVSAQASDGLEPYSGSDSFIFVSYKRDDFEQIRPLLQRVSGWGYRIWYDKGIPGGAEWDALIEDRLKRCAVLLFFMSRGSVESKYCRREVKFVDQLNKPIISLRLEPAELRHGLEMLLTQYKIINVTAEDFAGEFERALKYQRLL